MHVDARQMDEVRINRTARHDFLDLGITDLAAHRGGRIKVSRRLAEDQVAGVIGFPCLDDRQIGKDTFFHDVGLSIEVAVILAFGNHGSDACLGIKTGNARTTGTHPFSQGALRIELKLQLAGQVLAHEFRVFAHVRRHHFLDLSGRKQFAQTKIIHPSVV